MVIRNREKTITYLTVILLIQLLLEMNLLVALLNVVRHRDTPVVLRKSIRKVLLGSPASVAVRSVVRPPAATAHSQSRLFILHPQGTTVKLHVPEQLVSEGETLGMREEDEGERLLFLGLAVYWNSDALERTSLRSGGGNDEVCVVSLNLFLDGSYMVTLSNYNLCVGTHIDK